jgi:RimJ/RimL family protein N-acetyltransferase
MSVARRWRGRGVGRKLLAAAIDETRQWPGFCRIELECVAWNQPGVRLYESLGFVLEARKTKAVNLRGRPEDMLLMALTW